MARDSLKWQHLDMDGKKIENGGIYSFKDVTGRIAWSPKYGYMIEVFVEGSTQYSTIPFDYRGNRVCVYKVRRVE